MIGRSALGLLAICIVIQEANSKAIRNLGPVGQPQDHSILDLLKNMRKSATGLLEGAAQTFVDITKELMGESKKDSNKDLSKELSKEYRKVQCMEPPFGKSLRGCTETSPKGSFKIKMIVPSDDSLASIRVEVNDKIPSIENANTHKLKNNQEGAKNSTRRSEESFESSGSHGNLDSSSESLSIDFIY